MSEKIKLIWDFRGPAATQTALHHEIHLKEFCNKEKYKHIEVGTKKISDHYSTAFLIVPKALMIEFRDTLRPHRGETA
ncbi:MAG: hypothetical protein ABF304_05275 [Flavobacteriaceae bacterium]|nr:hypothetical protein [Flavobacteriaceae bacterium LSUCC0859]